MAAEGKNYLTDVADSQTIVRLVPVSYTHLRAHETVLDLVCRLLLEKKKHHINYTVSDTHIKTKNTHHYDTTIRNNGTQQQYKYKP